MGALGVVLFNPVFDNPLCLTEGGEHMQPDAFFFQGPHEAFHYPVLFGGVRRDVLGIQAIGSYQLQEFF